MARDGFEAATVAAIVKESGIPASSVYHYFGSKDGVLLAVMERGAERFFAELPEPRERAGTAEEHLSAMVAGVVHVLDRHPDFLRLLIVFATQPPDASDGQVREVVNRVRATALERITGQLALAFGDEPDDPHVLQLARFTLASIDGAFVAHQSDPKVGLDEVLAPFPQAAGSIRAGLRKSR